MQSFSPVIYVTGLLLAALGASMLVPAFVELAIGTVLDAVLFLEAAAVTTLFGLFMSISVAGSRKHRLSRQGTFLLTTGVWFALPIFGALPFLLSPSPFSVTDAFFEAMSGLTTTGATIIPSLGDIPPGLLLWRSMLQWFGGIGIIVVAMVFLPELRVGGMQIFRSEGFDTMGKILPRAAEIARQIGAIYVVLTIAAALAYLAVGMGPFDAVNHALTTLATGGYSTRDASFGAFGAGAQIICILFMLLASLPFVRYVQLGRGMITPIQKDPQILAFMLIVICVCAGLSLLMLLDSDGEHPGLLGLVFNVMSLASGTGYASADYQQWGAPAIVILFAIGLIGGCAGSTCCSVKVFRWQILVSALYAQLRRIQSPSGLFSPRFSGRKVTDEVLGSVMAFFTMFLLSLAIVSVLLALTGLDFTTSVSGAASALANIGPGFGNEIGPTGNYAEVNATAKWILSAAMLLGRLEILAVMALFTRAFWVR